MAVSLAEITRGAGKRHEREAQGDQKRTSLYDLVGGDRLPQYQSRKLVHRWRDRQRMPDVKEVA